LRYNGMILPNIWTVKCSTGIFYTFVERLIEINTILSKMWN